MTHYTESNYYELLEVEPGATSGEIDEAYKRQLELLSGAALATYGLFVGDDLVGARQRVEDAYRVLRDPVRRRAYDASGYAHVPEVEAEAEAGLEVPVEAQEAAAEATMEASVAAAEPAPVPEPVSEPVAEAVAPPVPAPERQAPAAPASPAPPAAAAAGESAGYDGPAFRAAREARGISLGEISARTRIAEYYLGYIEEERFDQLPPIIYLRSYLRQYAAAIGLDPENTINRYLARYNEKRGRKQPDRP